MSSLAVRQAVEEAWPLLVPGLPMVSTINEAVPNPGIFIWATLTYATSARIHESMGSNPWIEEQGTVTVTLMALSGVGDEDVAAAADLVVKGWELWINASQTIWIRGVGAPSPPDSEALGDIYRLVVDLEYSYQTRGGL